jgi:hypothetical protein
MKKKLINKNYFLFLYLIFCGKVFYPLFGDIDYEVFKYNFFYIFYIIKELILIIGLLISCTLANKEFLEDTKYILLFILVIFILYLLKISYFQIQFYTLDNLKFVKNFFLSILIIFLPFIFKKRNLNFYISILQNICIISGIVVLMQVIFFDYSTSSIGFQSNRPIGIFDSPNTLSKFAFFTFIVSISKDLEDQNFDKKKFLLYILIFSQMILSITLSVIVALLIFSFFLFLISFIILKKNLKIKLINISKLFLIFLLSIFLLKIFFPFYIDTILLRIQILFDFIFNIFNYQIPITQPGYHTFSLRGDQYESIYKQLEDLIFYTNKYVDKYYVLKNLFILIFLGQNYNFDNNDIGYLNILSNHGVFFILIVFFLYCYFSYLFFSMKKTLKKSYTFFIENLSLFYFFLGVIIINFFTKIYLIVPINYILFLFIGLTLRNAQKLKHYVNFT